jgi:hypothetical protein
MAVASAAVVVVNLVRRDTGSLHPAAAALALLMTTAVTATVDIVLHYTVFAHRAVVPVPVWWAWLKHAFGGVALALSVWWVSTGLVDGLVHPAPSLWLTIPALAVWGGSAVTVTLDLWWRSARSRTELLEEADRLDLAVVQQRALADEIVQTRAAAVSDAFRRLRGDLDGVVSSVTSATEGGGRQIARQLADDLRQASQGVVRHASSDLWTRAERHLPRVTWRMQLANTLRTQPFRPLVIITVGVMPRMLWEVGDLGLARGGVTTLVGTLLLLTLCSVANRAMTRWPSWHSTIFATTVILLQVGQVTAAAFKNSWIPGYVTAPDLVVQVFSGVLLILFSSGWATFWNLTQRRDDLFAERMTPAREQALARSMALAQAARSLAHDLHGGAQARLFACAMALEEAADSGDVAALNEALAGARYVLEQPLATPHVDHDLDSAVAEATRAWNGLCEVSVHRSGLAGEGFDPVAVRRVVDEGMVNAVRHGGAGRVDVEIRVADDGWLRIQMRDDGAPASMGSRRGLGSAMFDHLAPGRWGRQSDGSGTTLWLELAPVARGTRPDHV